MPKPAARKGKRQPPAKKAEPQIAAFKPSPKASKHILVNDATEKVVVKQLADCYVSPYDHPCRLPTVYQNESSLFNTRTTFEVTVPSTGTGAGHFAFFVQPKLGDPSDPKSLKIGLINFESGLVTDTTQLSAYSNVSELAMDPNTVALTQSTNRIYGMNATTPSLADPLAGVAGPFPSSNGTPVAYGMELNHTAVVDATFPQGGYSRIIVPPGSYDVFIQSKFTTAPTTGVNAINLGVYDSKGVQLTGQSETIFSGNINLVGGDLQATSLYGVNVPSGYHVRLWTKAGPTAVDNNRIIFQTAVLPNVAWDSNDGIAESVRPVALSVLSSCRASTISDGGDLITMFTTRDMYDKVFTNSAVNWTIPDGMTKMSGWMRTKVRDGSYCWWAPSCQEDTFFRSVQDANQYEYPMIMVCGKTDGNTSSPLSVTVDFVYEVLHQSQLFERKHQLGSTRVYEEALKAVGQMQHISENRKHGGFLTDVARVIGAAAPFAPLLAGLF